MSENVWQQEDCISSKNSGIQAGHHGVNMLCAALVAIAAGCTTYIERPQAGYPAPPPPSAPPTPPPPVVVYVEPPPVESAVSIRITVESDFYEPLSPYGRWEFVPPYGRCWIPARMATEWRPYCNGHWERTERGWYWASDEPWAWATYHYGRWDWRPEFGWYWVPQTQWAPAWVSWHRSDRYLGWAPLHPSARFAAGGVVEVNERVIPPRAYVFVEEKRFLEPVRPATVVVNNTTIINKTVNITNVKIVNKTVINEGPRTDQIEHDSGRKVQVTPAQDLRRRSEAQVVARQPIRSPGRDVSQPNRRPPEATAAKPVITNESSRSEKAVVTDPGASVPAGPRRPQEVEAKPTSQPPQVRSEPERPKLAKETVAPKEKESAPKPIQKGPEKKGSEVVTEAATSKRQTRATEKREEQTEKKSQQTQKLHPKPKHDQVAAEQGSKKPLKKAKETEEESKPTEKN